ncbi:hypothetical protein NL676_029063 [Syzygium grande]|nr:hypothetical protein NL676_029063 [Syzygium grande]
MRVEAALPAPYPTAPRALRQRLFALLRSSSGGGGSPRRLAQVHAQVVVNGCAGSSSVLAQLLARYVGSGLLADASRAFQGAWNPEHPRVEPADPGTRAGPRTARVSGVLRSDGARGCRARRTATRFPIS